MRIFLIGFMGSGKSHTGQQLAEQLSYPLIDTDRLIEKNENTTIKKIFDQQGETAFRQLERKVLRATTTHTDAVIATGGGLPCFYDNMDFMLAKGVCFYLYLPVKTLKERLQTEQIHRPLIADLDDKELTSFIQSKLAERQPTYKQAHHKINADKNTLEQLLQYLKPYQLK